MAPPSSSSTFRFGFLRPLRPLRLLRLLTPFRFLTLSKVSLFISSSTHLLRIGKIDKTLSYFAIKIIETYRNFSLTILNSLTSDGWNGNGFVEINKFIIKPIYSTIYYT